MRLSPRALWRATVPAVAAAVVVGFGATAAHGATDAPSHYPNVTTTTAQNTWTTGVMSSVQDADTYRFVTTQDRFARILLGDLGANYRIRLLDAAGQTIGYSDRAGLANEEIYRRLVPGTYYVRVEAPHAASARPYALRFQSLPEGMVLLSQAEQGSGNDRRLVFEVLNNTSRSTDGVGYELRDTSPCVEDGDPFTIDCEVYPVMAGYGMILGARQRATLTTYEIQGMTSYSFTLTAPSPIPQSSDLSVHLTGGTGTTRTGTVTNHTQRWLCAEEPVRTAYDARGRVLSSFAVPTTGMLAPGASRAWSVPNVPGWPPGAVRVAWDAAEHSPDFPCYRTP